ANEQRPAADPDSTAAPRAPISPSDRGINGAGTALCTRNCEALQTGYTRRRRSGRQQPRLASCALSTPLPKLLSEGRFQLQMVEAVDRFDVNTLHLAPLQHVERDAHPRVSLRPDLAVELGQTLRRVALYSDDHIAAPEA